ncbi:APC family permease [Limosilactobacillus sp.]|uniref:APC family permease n=1 Tax=Limosilactobacillus sp. TaxID=2773925 RepID=UPI003F107A84
MAEKQPTRSLGFFAALSTVTGTVIGSGIFFKVPAVTKATGTVSMATFTWLLAGIITICAGLTAAELAAAYPQTGGLTVYVGKAYGSFWGFLAGWAQSLIYFPAQWAAAAIAFATQFVDLFGLASSWLPVVASAVTLLVLMVNFISAKAGGMVSSIALVVKLLPIVAIVVLGFAHPGDPSFTLFPVTPGPRQHFWTALGSGLLATMFAYDGWIHVGTMAGELKKPKRDLPRAIFFGLGLVTVVYLLISLAFLYVAPLATVANNLNISSQVAHIVFGPLGGKIITIGIMVSVYGALNGFVMTGIRVPYVMGYLGYLPFSRGFRALNRGGVPWLGGCLQFIIALLMILSGTFDTITNMLVVVIWFFYMLCFVAVFILRRTAPNLERPYRVPGYPIVPIIALAGGAFIVLTTAITQPIITAIGVLVTAAGIPVYQYQKVRHRINQN